MTPETLIAYALVLPLVGAALIWLFGKIADLREFVTLATGGGLLYIVISLLWLVLDGEQPELKVLDVVPGLTLSFKVEPLGMLFALIASGLWIVNSIYSIGYMRGNNEPRQTPFYISFAVAISSTIGVAFAENLFTLFLAYEILTLSTYPLVTHKANSDAMKAGRLYLILLMATSMVLFLPAIIWTYALTGTLSFAPGGILSGKADGLTVSILMGLYVFGIGKAATMPVHFWLPAAMVAPTPVSALLHAVAVVKAGVFSVLKITIYIFGIDLLSSTGASDWVLYISAGTVLLASLIAMTKDNLKARLAYSTISQLAYIVVGAMLASRLGMIGGGLQIAMHAVGKITLFMCAGAIYTAAHKTKVSELSGLAKAMPFTFAAFAIGALSIIGLPPMGGLWSKWYLALGALQADHLVIVAVLMISSLLNIAYLMPIPFKAFFGKPADGVEITEIKEAPLACLIAIAITATGTVLLFFFPGTIFELLQLIKTQ
jgi:multicomponent Na+:H+ antiporter subunit D